MASPFAHWGSFFDVEYRVNGVWNKILNDTFHPGLADGNFLINAETYPRPTDTKGLMADLTVNRLLVGFPKTIDFAYLVFEGKGANSGDNWNAIAKQLGDWFAISKTGAPFTGFRSWAIGAKGSEVAFFHYLHNPAAVPAQERFTYQSISRDNNGHYHLVEDNKLWKYDISRNDGWAAVNGAMHWIAANAP